MQEEQYGTRDLTYSAWHRRLSTRRFVGIERAQALAMIDLDAALYIEYDQGSKHPVALIETARDVGQALPWAHQLAPHLPILPYALGACFDRAPTYLAFTWSIIPIKRWFLLSRWLKPKSSR